MSRVRRIFRRWRRRPPARPGQTVNVVLTFDTGDLPAAISRVNAAIARTQPASGARC